MKVFTASPIFCFAAALSLAAGAAVHALETTISPHSEGSAPWQGTDHEGKPTSTDVEIVRSIELNYGLNQNDSTAYHSSTDKSNSTHSSNPALKENSEKPELKPLSTFKFDDILLQTDSENENISRKQIQARSILEEEESDNDFDFHSRLLLGKVLLRRSDNDKSASVRQSRVLDFEPIHTSKNDYPSESVPKKQSPRRYSARHRAKNVTTRTSGSNSRRHPTVETSTIGLDTSLKENTSQEEISRNKQSETVAAAANRLEFGAKTSSGVERGAARYKLRAQAQQTSPPPPKDQDIYLVSSTIPPTTKYREHLEESQKATHPGEEKRNEPYSSVTIQRGTIHQIPEAITKHINLDHSHVRKQPTQVIFIQPFAEYENRPSSPHLPSAPVFDNHQWIPIQAEDAYVPVLVNPPHRPHVKSPSLSSLQHQGDHNIVNQVKHVHSTHFNEAVPLHVRFALQHLPSPSHIAPSTYVDAHRSLDLSTQHTVPEYIQRGWSWTLLQHPRTDSSS